MITPIKMPYAWQFNKMEVYYVYNEEMTLLENVYALYNEMKDMKMAITEIQTIMADFIELYQSQMMQITTDTLELWKTDGTFATLIDELLLNQKADISYVDQEITTVNQRIDDIDVVVPVINYELVELIAHRGFSTVYPENTLFAMQKALHDGCQFLELDVQFTSDGVPICMHDLTVNRTTNGTGTVKSFTAAAITTLDAGIYLSSFYQGIKVPTLESVLKAVPSAKKIYVEIKDYNNLTEVSNLIAWLVSNGYQDRVILQSFNYPTVINAIRGQSQTIIVGALATDQNSFNQLVSTIDDHSMMLIPLNIATDANRLACLANNKDVGVWTINTSDDLVKALKAGYTKIMTNKPMEVIL